MNHRTVYIFIALMLLSELSFAQSGSGRSSQSTLNRSGRQEKVSLNLNGVSLFSTLRLIAERLDKNLIIGPEVKDRQLNMFLTDISPRAAFAAVLEANELAFKALDGNILYITRADKIHTQRVVTNIACKYADAAKLQELLQNVILLESGTVMADARTNTLVISASPQTIERVKRIVAELDQPIRQVYIQAEIVEASSDNDSRLGVEWLFDNLSHKSTDAAVGSDFGLQQKATEEDETAPRTRNGVPLPIGEGLGVGILNSELSVVLNALEEVNNVNLLSRPRVMTMDNQEATIEVGDQIPFKVLNEFGVTSFEFKDATIKLLVKPHIVDSNYIMLEVAPKADFQNGVTSDGTPIIATRKASTRVKIRNGQTIVIGGLIRDSETQTQRKVPLLGDIPLLGALFKSSSSTNIKTELLVFITPIIIDEDGNEELFERDFELREKIEKRFE